MQCQSSCLAQENVCCPNFQKPNWRATSSHNYSYPTVVSANSGQSGQWSCYGLKYKTFHWQTAFANIVWDCRPFCKGLNELCFVNIETAQEVVIMTTPGAASDENFIIHALLLFLFICYCYCYCCCYPLSMILLAWGVMIISKCPYVCW